MRIKHIALWCLATALCLLPLSCDKNEPSVVLSGTSASSAGMNLKVTTNGIIPVRSDAGTLTRVFGDPDDDIIMTEYVSDIADIMPETKGTVITTDNITTTSSPISGGSFLVNAYRAFSQSELMETGDKDTVDNDDDVYNNGTMSKTTKTVWDFSMLSSYSGGKWSWSGTQPHWRNKSVFSIWSMFPANSTSLSPATLNPAMPQPDWTNTALDAIADVDPSGKTEDEIAAAEKARQEEIQAYLRSMTFDYTLPHYAPTTNSTSIYKDLLFAYNEEMREFEVENGKLKEDASGNNIIKGGKSQSFDVTFYHALAAVKFVLDTDTAPAGADIHSVTLCYTNASGNIVTTDGIATKGTCTASATKGDGSRPVGFTWTSQTNKKPVHFEFNDGTSSTKKVSGDYANTGDGVLFMIPQSATGLKVIVEFSKYGSTQYYTKVITKGLDINWQAGKCYTYTFKIGEFHVPGENYPELVDVDIVGLKNSGDNIQPSSALNIKGVTKMGLVINSWKLGSKAGQTVYLNAIIDGDSQVAYKTVDKVTSPDESNTNFDVNFAPVSESSLTGTNDRIYTFGTDNAEETYHKYYSFSPPTGGRKSNMGTPNIGPFHYVFDTTGASTFKIMFTPAAGDNSGGFWADVRCLIVVEVEIDDNLPGNFNTINWAAI